MKTANQILSECGINTMSLNDEFNTQLLHAIEEYAHEKNKEKDKRIHFIEEENNKWVKIYYEGLQRISNQENTIDGFQKGLAEMFGLEKNTCSFFSNFKEQYDKLPWKKLLFEKSELEEKPNKPETKLAKEWRCLYESMFDEWEEHHKALDEIRTIALNGYISGGWQKVIEITTKQLKKLNHGK